MLTPAIHTHVWLSNRSRHLTYAGVMNGAQGLTKLIKLSFAILGWKFSRNGSVHDSVLLHSDLVESTSVGRQILPDTGESVVYHCKDILMLNIYSAYMSRVVWCCN